MFSRKITIALSFHPILPMVETVSGVVSASLSKGMLKNRMPKFSITSKLPTINSLSPKKHFSKIWKDLEPSSSRMLLKSSHFLTISKTELRRTIKKKVLQNLRLNLNDRIRL